VALVRVAERERIRRVFTVDRDDFEIYRPYRLGRFEILPRSGGVKFGRDAAAWVNSVSSVFWTLSDLGDAYG
jgi:hypothetical protein